MTHKRFKYFAIFGAMRTGSNLLERSLSQFDGITCYGELFNPGFVGKAGKKELIGVSLAAREKDPGALIAAMIADAGGTLPGFRIFQGHDERIMTQALTDPDCGKIILRRNPIDSFVSLKIARQTDQWMLGNVAKRKSAKVMFDPDEYGDYLARLGAFHAHLTGVMQDAGQTAFDISYPDLKSASALNGIARYLGIKGEVRKFAEPIKRQNPEPLHEKVINYESLLERVNPGEDRAQVAFGDVSAGAMRERIVASPSLPVLYAALPGTESDPIADWLKRLSGRDLVRFASQKDLTGWLEDAPGLVSFAMLTHPVPRAYGTFCRRILHQGDGNFPRIRRRLAAHFDVLLPDDGPLDAAQTAASFEAFCVFLKANLAGQTGLRIDDDWAPQDQLVERLCTLLPMHRLVRADQTDSLVADVSALAGETSAPDFPAQDWAVPLDQVYSRRVENLLRAAYARDYRKFGFGDWSGGL